MTEYGYMHTCVSIPFLEKMTTIDSEILCVGNKSNSQIVHDLWNLKRRMDGTDEGLSLKSC